MSKQPFLKIVKPSTEAQKATLTTLDTIIVTPNLAKSWKLPSFQRHLKVTARVLEVKDKIVETQVIPGVLTIGIFDKEHYMVDGQHRREAFILADIPEAFADVRYTHFETFEEMADEYVELNGRLNVMKPDDILRAMEERNDGLRKIRKEFGKDWVGYDNVRRGDRSPVVSMSSLLRCWFGSSTEVPALRSLATSELAFVLTDDEVDSMLGFLKCAKEAWGRDEIHHRLWLNLNLCVSMWCYRRLVVNPSGNVKRVPRELFTKCLMSLAADGTYVDWLLGRNLRERDRSPAYSRLKAIFARRVEQETGTKPRLPQPEWGGR